MQIIPSILSDQLDEVRIQLDRIKNESSLSRVQVDVVDPEFADDVTLFPLDLLELDLHGLTVDIHLMTNDPIELLDDCQRVPGVGIVIAQVEHMESQRDFLAAGKKLGLEVGLSLDLTTPPQAIEQESWESISVLQIMGIRAGAQGRVFEPSVLNKIKSVKKSHPSVELLVDGGVKPENYHTIQAAGADGVTVGSFLWESPNLADAIAALVSHPIE